MMWQIGLKLDPVVLGVEEQFLEDYIEVDKDFDYIEDKVDIVDNGIECWNNVHYLYSIFSLYYIIYFEFYFFFYQKNEL